MATDVPHPSFTPVNERSTVQDLARNARDVVEWASQIKRAIDDGIDGGTP